MQQQFTWNLQHEHQVRREWQKLARIRLKDMVNKTANEPPEEIITWMIDEINASLKYMRENNADFKERSKETS